MIKEFILILTTHIIIIGKTRSKDTHVVLFFIVINPLLLVLLGYNHHHWGHMEANLQ